MDGVVLRAALFGCALGLMFAVAACAPESSTSGEGATSGESSTTSTGSGPAFVPTGFACSGTKVDYMTQVAPFFGAQCGGVEGCHIPMHTAEGAYKLVVNQVAAECEDGRLKVKPGDAEHSYAIQKMTNTNLCGGLPMPKNVTGWIELPTNEIQLVYDWICEGAKKD